VDQVECSVIGEVERFPKKPLKMDFPLNTLVHFWRGRGQKHFARIIYIGQQVIGHQLLALRVSFFRV